MRLRAPALAIALIVPFTVGANAQQPRLRLAESEVKAALIYTFLRYTTWPGANVDAPLLVCTWRQDGLSGRLAPIEGRTVNQHVIALSTVSRAEQLPACSLIYIDTNQLASWSSVQSGLAGRPVLTVSDAAGFVVGGGMIELSTANNHVEVRLNAAAIASAHLGIEDRLWRLAEFSSSPRP